ncbi:MAG: DUF2520 domain-containing protein [Muribaculaceae bacterium]|nr:DUF2520 domain-containing protein [Muribaculaceae bacterium]
MEGRRVVILGSGNVATHLASALYAAGADIRQIYSPTAAHAKRLATAVGAEAVDSPGAIIPDADFYIISTVDGAVAEVAASMPRVKGIVVHTSGSVPMDVLLPASDRVGVMYPLQSFSRDRKLDMKRVPFFNESSDATTLNEIDSLTGLISDSVQHADSSTRPFLHVAGVLGCNFPNFLLGCASEVLARGGYSLDVLRPLLEETVDKAFTLGPEESQTGPARRGDTDTILCHERLLPSDTAEIYKKMSEAIMKHYRQ